MMELSSSGNSSLTKIFQKGKKTIMKKIISIALLTAMLLTCFAGCAMQKGEVDVENYVEEAEAQDTAVTIPTDWKNGLTAWDGSVDETWYDADKTEFEIADGADLRAFIVAVRTNKVTFAGKKITVTKDINLGGKEWAAIVSDNNDGGVFFAGEFDGNNKIIGNFKMTLNDDVKDTNLSSNTDACNTADAVGGHALLGSIGNGAILKDLKVVEATYVIGYTSQKSSVVGGVVAEINNAATVSNVYASGTITQTGTASFTITGGIVGKVKGSNTVNITNCVSNVAISVKSSQVGGIVGTVNSGVKNIVVSDCEITAPISGNGQVAGIIGYFANSDSSNNLKATVENCQVKANITASGNIVAGIIAQPASKNRTYVIKNCDIPADANVTIQGPGQQSGGVLGIVAGNAIVKIQDCDINATINFTGANGQAGGIVGTCGAAEMTIDNCHFNGTFNSDRSSGGIVGATDNNNNLLINNCSVSGTLNFNLKGVKNLYVGGILGLGRAGASKTIAITNCTMAATMNVTFNHTTSSTSGDGTVSRPAAAGGLIGVANDTAKSGSMYVLQNNKVTGKLNFTDNDKAEGDYTDPKADDAGTLIGFTATNATTIQYGGNVVTSEVTATGMAYQVGRFGGDCDYNYIELVGYQTTEVVDGKYDLRIVAAADGDIEALGFIANIKYVDENGVVLGDKMVTEYVEKVYTSVKGGDTIYKATDYSADYLYTLTIKNIPATVTAENMGIQIHAIGADVAGDAITYLRGAFVTYGAYKSMASKNDVVIADSEEEALAATLAGVLGEGNVAEISKTLIGGYQDNYYSAAAEVNNAVYPSTNAPYDKIAVAREANVFTVTINAEVAGEYDIILEIRAKDASVRSTYMYINDQDGYFIHNDKYVNADSYNSDNTNNANSRFVKIGTCTLKAGRNTVTFKIDNEIGGVLHPRAIYFDAVAK